MGVGGQHTDRDAIARELATPGLPAERLAQIAAAHAEFHPAIAAHPNAYPGLVDWIAAQAPVQAPGRTQSPVPVQSQPLVRDPAEAPVQPSLEQPTAASAGAAPRPAPPSLDPAAPRAVGASATPPEAPAPKLDRAAKTGALFAGLGIGVLVGAAVSAVLLLWVLPGLFGSVLG